MNSRLFIFTILVTALCACHKTETQSLELNLVPKDADGNVYDTVRIGTQVWMKQNLKTAHFNDGTAIPNVMIDSLWDSLKTPAYVYYNHDSSDNAIYGKLYNWYAVNSGKLAPEGWHIPTDDEWTALINYLGGDSAANGKMREAGTAHWHTPNTGATNASGFTAMPSGNHNTGDGPPFAGLGSYTGFWSSTEMDANEAWMRNVQYNLVNVEKDHYLKGFGFSVRCIRNQ
jgi:uncharacterized protein (TIGR02145 family)